MTGTDALRPSLFPVTLPVYQGPLDLLLQLIERQELDITKVSLAQVTDQYLAHVRAMDHQNFDGLADFLVIAAKLILIKSEALLPRPPDRAQGEQDPGEELARQLMLYKQYKEIAGILRRRSDDGLRTYLRVAAPPRLQPALDLSNVTARDLWGAVNQALAMMALDAPALSTVVAPAKITIRDRIRRIQLALRGDGRATLFGVLKDSTSRIEVIVTFLAVLELVKLRRMRARQEELFGDILLEPIGDWVNDDSFQISSEPGQGPEDDGASSSTGGPARSPHP